MVPVTVTASVVVVLCLECLERGCPNASGATSAQQVSVIIVFFIMISPLLLFMNRDNPQPCACQVTNREVCVTNWQHKAILPLLALHTAATNIIETLAHAGDSQSGGKA